MDSHLLPDACAEPVSTTDDPSRAEAACRAVLAACPDDARVLGNLGGVLNELCRFDEAEAVLLRAVALDPAGWGAWSNLGNTMVEQQRFDDAIAAFSNCLRLNPSHAPALANLGVALTARGAPAAALPFLDMAVGLDPQNAETRCNRALALLADGDYRRGFAEYEWRWQTRAKPPHCLPVPLWDGGGFRGRTLLLHDEGGFGDTLQFCRYAPLVKARGGRVVLRARAPLLSVLSRLPGIDAVVEQGQPLPPIDLHCPMFSLPHLIGTTLDTIPFADGYLSTDPARDAAWADLLDADAARLRPNRRPFRVGLVWAGGPHPYNRESALADNRRSLSLAALAPLAQAAPHALFYSVQKGEAAAQAAVPPSGMILIDHSERLHSFDDTASLVSQLDLVIAVDTSTAHLAAALGRPVWMLSRFDQCWRWLTGRTDTPWYRSMRLYQQPEPFDWTIPIARLAADLAARADMPGDGQPGAARIEALHPSS